MNWLYRYYAHDEDKSASLINLIFDDVKHLWAYHKDSKSLNWFNLWDFMRYVQIKIILIPKESK